MSTKAKLTIVLKADETIVAEVEDAILWQKVLSALHGDSFFSGKKEDPPENPEPINKNGSQGKETRVSKFATRIGVSESILIGALDPSIDPPYMHLDRHCWEAFKKQTPSRGRGAVSPTALVGTLLSLWLTEIGLNSPSQAQVRDALKTISVIDKNPGRGISGATWLQTRAGGTIVINPAEISRAAEIVKSFCMKDWTQNGSEK